MTEQTNGQQAPEQPTPQQQTPHPPPPPPYAASPAAAEATRRLTRSRDDRWISGVCGGVARYAGIDANLVRLLVVLGTLLGFGSLAIAYVIAWILMPEE